MQFYMYPNKKSHTAKMAFLPSMAVELLNYLLINRETSLPIFIYLLYYLLFATCILNYY